MSFIHSTQVYFYEQAYHRSSIFSHTWSPGIICIYREQKKENYMYSVYFLIRSSTMNIDIVLFIFTVCTAVRPILLFNRLKEEAVEWKIFHGKLGMNVSPNVRACCLPSKRNKARANSTTAGYRQPQHRLPGVKLDLHTCTSSAYDVDSLKT